MESRHQKRVMEGLCTHLVEGLRHYGDLLAYRVLAKAHQQKRCHPSLGCLFLGSPSNDRLQHSLFHRLERSIRAIELLRPTSVVSSSRAAAIAPSCLAEVRDSIQRSIASWTREKELDHFVFAADALIDLLKHLQEIANEIKLGLLADLNSERPGLADFRAKMRSAPEGETSQAS